MGAKSLCIPFDQKRFGDFPEDTKCINCGDKAKRWTMFGRSEFDGLHAVQPLTIHQATKHSTGGLKLMMMKVDVSGCKNIHLDLLVLSVRVHHPFRRPPSQKQILIEHIEKRLK